MVTFRNKRMVVAIIGLVVMTSATVDVWAKSARELITEGNRAYQDKKYDDALKAYDEASLQEPNSPYIDFDKGTVYYQKGDFEKAKTAFESAALKTKDLSMEARCKYNLGNCYFNEAKQLQEKDREKALSTYGTGIECYQAARKLDPEFQDAAHNIEVSRLAMKTLLEQMKKEQEQAEKEKKEREKAAEKLKQLMDQQQKNMQESQKLDSQKSQTQPTDEMKKRSQELAKEQQKIKEETQKLAEQMKQSDPQKQPEGSPEKKAADHLEKSAAKQEQAQKELQKEQVKESQASQKDALGEMQKALENLSEPQKEQSEQNKKDPQGQQGQPDQKNQQEQKQNQATSQPTSQPKPKDENKDPQKAATPRNEEARDILNEEKENRQERGKEIQGGYQPVDKNW